jgi:ureidoacrylate peracid hydrolase
MPTIAIQARPEAAEIDPARTALIVVDMQNAFGAPGGMFDKAGVPIASIQAAVAPTRTVVDSARRAGLPVIFVKIGFRRDLADLGADDGPNAHFLAHLGVQDGVLERDTWATDIVDGLTPMEGDHIVWKTRFSAFHKTELDELLRRLGVTHLVVTGCTTSICVESTVRDAFFLDYHCLVLEDCTAEPMGAGLSRSNHEASLLLFERIFGSVSASDDFCIALEAIEQAVAPAM